MVTTDVDRRCWCSGYPQDPEGCPILREFRQLATPAGRELACAEYLAEASARGTKALSKGEAAHRLQNIGAPAMLITALRDTAPTLALTTARQFLDQVDRHFLVFIGASGIGKSVAAAYVLQDFVRRHRWNEQPTGANQSPAVFIAARELTGVTAWDDEHRRQMKTAQAAQVLVIDDMGDEGTPAGKDALVGLLLGRADNRRRTVITSNLVPAAFGARYGAALSDRFRQCAMAPNLAGEKSLRKRAA